VVKHADAGTGSQKTPGDMFSKETGAARDEDDPVCHPPAFSWGSSGLTCFHAWALTND